jgi:hypothetical protein
VRTSKRCSSARRGFARRSVPDGGGATDVVGLHAPNDRLHLVEKGRLDARAVLAFTNGHCHSLALALNVATGWPIVGLYRERDECLHMVVQGDTDQLIDIGGARTADEVMRDAPSSELRVVHVHDVGPLWRKHAWAAPEPEIASSWVPPVLDQAKRQAAHIAGTTFRIVIGRPDDLEVQVAWDGEPHLIAYVRRTGDATTAWTRCAAIPVPKHEATGEHVIDYRPEAFENERACMPIATSTPKMLDRNWGERARASSGPHRLAVMADRSRAVRPPS